MPRQARWLPQSPIACRFHPARTDHHADQGRRVISDLVNISGCSRAMRDVLVLKVDAMTLGRCADTV
ncbi:MAG: hypothetical protein COB69_01535 [Phycisphaera sp.]|nr:MAG: hypothetical protein COB69_01535 [Phycisphaera sp.]